MRKPIKEIRRMPKIYNYNQKPKRSYHFLGRFLKLIFFGAVMLSFLYFFLLSDYFKVKTVFVGGLVLGNEDQIKEKIPTGINIFFLEKQKILKGISQDPLFENIHLYKGLPDGVKIVLQERAPVMVWQSGPKSYLLDKDGVAFFDLNLLEKEDSDVGNMEKISSLPRVTDVRAVSVQAGKWVVSSGFLKFIMLTQESIIKYLPDFQTTGVEIMDTTYDVAFLSNSGVRVLFNTLDSPDVQVRNLARLFQQNKVGDNSVVDLRINRWAYVSQ